MIGFFEYQYLKFKKIHLQNLVALARIDGHVDKSEIKFLREIGKKYGLKEKQISDILNAKESREFEISENFSHRIGQLYDIVGMMMADEVIDKKEMDFCEQICSKMKLKSELIHEMVKIYKRGGVEDFEEWEDFVEKSKKYSMGD